MSVMMIASEVQIWDNAAFDNGDSEDTTSIRDSWSNIQAFECIDSEMEKENQSSTPMVVKSPVSFKTPLLVKPLHPKNQFGNKVGKDSTNCVPAKQCLVTPVAKRNGVSVVRDDEQIDKEIETIEKEIGKLRLRLQELKWEKAERKCNKVGFLDQKQGSRNLVQLKKLEDSVLASAGVATSGKLRGFSLGPAEIMSAAAKTRQIMISKMEGLTPLDQKQNKRKSCFWKLDQIDELKAAKENLSSSPKSKKPISKVPMRQAMTTVKKTAKRDDDSAVLSSLQPKKLFKEGEKTAKRPVRAGRVIASQYNSTTSSSNIQANENTALRKRSLPENGELKENERKRFSIGAKSCGMEGMQQQSRVKKKWEIPSEVVVYKSSDVAVDDDEYLLPSGADGLPKIKTMRCVAETPRDSGAVKRVAELEGKKSVFAGNEEANRTAWVRQALSFTDGDEE